MPLIGLGTGVNHLTRLLSAVPLPNTITITGEPNQGTLTTATAGQTHAAILAQIDEGTATTDGPGSVSITITLLGDSTDPVQSGQSITGVYLLYTATEAPSVPRNIVFDPVITVAVADPFTLTQNADNEAEIEATGAVTVTVTSPAIYADYDAGGGAGVFTFSTADLASGPVNLVPPQITGTADVGENLTITPGLWVYDGNNTVPTFSYIEDGAGTISTLTYTIAAGDAGNNVTFTEQAVGVNGTRTADSAPVAVSGAAPSVGIGAMEIDSTFVVGGGIGQMTINSTFEVA